jgi:hypothetical protein
MTVLEMSIDVRDQVQQLSTDRARKLQPEHIDWYLNRTQQEVIEAAIEAVPGSGRYRIKTNRHGIVAGLTVNRRSLSAAWNGEKYISTLPADFWYLIDDGSRVSQICKGDTKIVNYEVLNITRVPFPFSQLPTNCYLDLQLTYNNASIFNTASLLLERQITWNGLPQADAHFYVRELLQQELSKKGINVYWENYHDFHYPYQLIFVSTGASVPIVLQIDGTIYNGTTEVLTTEIHSSSRIVTTLAPNTMVSSDKEIATSATPFFRTSYISPISEKGAGVIYTHADNSFIVYTSVINYIRKPAVISLSLGTDCELSPDTHKFLCSKTAEMIVNRIDDPTWKDLTEQNTLNKQ